MRCQNQSQLCNKGTNINIILKYFHKILIKLFYLYQKFKKKLLHEIFSPGKIFIYPLNFLNDLRSILAHAVPYMSLAKFLYSYRVNSNTKNNHFNISCNDNWKQTRITKNFIIFFIKFIKNEFLFFICKAYSINRVSKVKLIIRNKKDKIQGMIVNLIFPLLTPCYISKKTKGKHISASKSFGYSNHIQREQIYYKSDSNLHDKTFSPVKWDF